MTPTAPGPPPAPGPLRSPGPLLSPGAPTLILIPTEPEALVVADRRRARTGSGLFALCGFGPIAAAASSARQLALLQPRRVLLVGIAGTFDAARHPVGSALAFAQVRLDGVGAGAGDEALGPRELGLPQWRETTGRDTEENETGAEVFDRLPLCLPRGLPRCPPGPGAAFAAAGGRAPELLTVCSCSASSAEAQRRRERFDQPAAEDMEGFGVALACRQFGIPLAIVRGISNEVGQRDPRHWAIEPAMHAAWDLACELLDADWGATR